MILRNSDMNDFVQVQLSSLLRNPPAFQSFKRDLQHLGLYSRSRGFSYQSDFMRVRTTRKTSRPRNYDLVAGRNTSVGANRGRSPRHRKQQSTVLPDITAKPQTEALKGPINTAFFRRNKTVVCCAVLFALFVKTDVIPSPSSQHKDKNYVRVSEQRLQKYNPGGLPLSLCQYHVLFFLHVSANFTDIAATRTVEVSDTLRESLQSAFRQMDKAETKRITKKKVSEQHLTSILEQKGPFASIAPVIAKFVFRRYPLLTEDSFLSFVDTFILTHDRLNQLRLCFDFYSDNEPFITTKGLFRLFRSEVSELLEQDLNALIPSLQGFDPECEGAKSSPPAKRRSQENPVRGENWKEISALASQKDSVNFRQFTRIFFAQRFPDALLVIALVIGGQELVNFLCEHFRVADFNVEVKDGRLSVTRWSLQHHLYEKRLTEKFDYYKSTLRDLELYSFMPLKDQKAVLFTFLLLCDVESVIRTETFTATRKSVIENSNFLFEKKCPMLTLRLIESIESRYSGEIDLWKFLDFFAQSLLKDKKESTDLIAFELFDADKNGFIGVVDVYELIESKETRGLTPLRSDLKRVKRELQDKAINGPKEELETAINFRRFQQLVPRPAVFEVIRMAFTKNYANRKKLTMRFRKDAGTSIPTAGPEVVQ